jgi:hypothetical protein
MLDNPLTEEQQQALALRGPTAAAVAWRAGSEVHEL